MICALLLTSLMCVLEIGTGNYARHKGSTMNVPEVARYEARATLLSASAMHCIPGASNDTTFQATQKVCERDCRWAASTSGWAILGRFPNANLYMAQQEILALVARGGSLSAIARHGY